MQLSTPASCKVDVEVEHESRKSCYCRIILGAWLSSVRSIAFPFYRPIHPYPDGLVYP